MFFLFAFDIPMVNCLRTCKTNKIAVFKKIDILGISNSGFIGMHVDTSTGAQGA